MKVAIIGAGPRGLWASEELMERARERGAVALQIRVRASNLDALRLYERRGAGRGFDTLVQAI